jgi:hypothetical protein
VIGRSEGSGMGGFAVCGGVSWFVGAWACVRGARALRVLGVFAGGVVLAGSVCPASALAASPWWRLSSAARPSDLRVGSTGQIVVIATNLGDADANGGSEPVKIADKLPAGLSATGVEGYVEEIKSGGGIERIALTCTLTPLRCSYAGVLAPYRQLQVLIDVTAEPSAKSGEFNEATISGGEAPGASASRGVPIGGGAPFGLEVYEVGAEDEDGVADSQAGSHPLQLTTAFMFNQTNEPGKPPALAKDLRLELPAGLIANSTQFPQCTETQFSTSSSGVDLCPADTALGVASVTVDDPADFGPAPVTLTVPVFNLAPAVGEPARFGLDVENVGVLLDASVRTGTDYGITLSAKNIPQTITLIGASLTLWGVPGDPRHDNARGWSCVDNERYRAIVGSLPSCATLGESNPPPLLTLPTSCMGLPEAIAEANSWSEPGVFGSYPSGAPLLGLAGCNRLPFSPSIDVAPDDQEADTPAGFAVRWHVPQEISLDAEGLAESDAKDMTVALPSGMQLDPAIEADTQGCTTSEIGFTGFSEFQGARTATFTPSLPGSVGSGETFEPGVNFCPDASKVATVKVNTPLLVHPLEGAMYLATRQNGPGPFEQLENQPGFVVGAYIVAEGPVAGVLVKIPATLTREPVSGQLVVGLEDMPQLPIEDTEIHFFGGEHAPFSTPASCGSYTTTASFAPWSGNGPVDSSSTFDINTGPDGRGPAGCPSPTQPTGGSKLGGGGSSSGLDATDDSTAPVTDLMPRAATTPVVTILGSKLVISGGTATVHVACSEATCEASIELVTQVAAKRHKDKSAFALSHTRETLVLATGSFSLAQDHSRTVVLRLTAAGKRMLAHANRHHPIAAKLRLALRGGRGTTRSVLAV